MPSERSYWSRFYDNTNIHVHHQFVFNFQSFTTCASMYHTNASN